MPRKLHMTSRADDILAFAREQARLGGSSIMNTGHLLLGMIVEPSGIAGDVLRKAGAKLDSARQALLSDPQLEEADEDMAARELPAP